jgi:hypothetical protein
LLAFDLVFFLKDIGLAGLSVAEAIFEMLSKGNWKFFKFRKQINALMHV